MVGFDGIAVHDAATSNVANDSTEAIVREREANRCVSIRTQLG